MELAFGAVVDVVEALGCCNTVLVGVEALVAVKFIFLGSWANIFPWELISK